MAIEPRRIAPRLERLMRACCWNGVFESLWSGALRCLRELKRKARRKVRRARSPFTRSEDQLLSIRSARRFSNEPALLLEILYSQPLVWRVIFSAISLASPSPVAAKESQ